MFFATFLMASAVCSGVICFNDVILVPAEVEGLFSVFDIKLDSNLCYKRNTVVGRTDTATKTRRKPLVGSPNQRSHTVVMRKWSTRTLVSHGMVKI